jgi:RNA polymerase sigma-70 factor (ECF subfamily)
MNHLSDAALVAELKAGNVRAFDEIYHRYYARLRMEANYKLKNPEDAATAVNDVLLNIWSKRKEIKEDVTLKNYLSRCISNRCIDFIRKNSHSPVLDLDIVDEKCASTQSDNAEDNDKTSRLLIAIQNLPIAQREVITLRLAGFSLKQIMDKTSKSRQTIKNLLTTAKKNLRKNLGFC